MEIPNPDFVISQAIDDIGFWQEMGFDPGLTSINIHPVQIKDQQRMLRLVDEVNAANISPDRLLLEITEECVVGRGRRQQLAHAGRCQIDS